MQIVRTREDEDTATEIATSMSAMGERESMAPTSTGEDICRFNELTPAPTSTTDVPIPSSSGEQMTLVSENTQDTAAMGNGIRRVQINYLDSDGNQQSELVDLDGTTPVNTVATDIRFVNSIHAKLTGSNKVASGHVKIYKTGTVGLVYNMIAAGGNMSLVPNRMVPAGKTLHLTSWHASEAQGRRVNVRIRADNGNGVFLFKDVEYLNKSTTGTLELNAYIPSLSIVKISGWPDTAGAEVGCGWKGTLQDN